MPKAGGSHRPRFRLLPTVLLTVAILALPTVVYAVGRSSSSFDIERITVAGANVVPEKRVLRLLRRDYQGHNLFTVTAGDVRATLSPLCYVSGVTIDRDFPGTLRVRVVEHVPAVYALAGTRWYVLAGDGHVICAVAATEDEGDDREPATSSSSAASANAGAETTDAGAVVDLATGVSTDEAAAAPASELLARLVRGPRRAALDLPRVTVAGRLRAGGTVKDRGLLDTLAVVAALPRSLRSRLDVVQTDDAQITLRFGGGPVAVWGGPERTLAKTVALRAVLARYDDAGETCTFIDVAIPDRVLARPVLD